MTCQTLTRYELDHATQQKITRLCVHCGLLLMQYGAESTVVVDLTKRLGIAMGVDGVECALSFNAITLTTLYRGHCITTARNTIHQGINVDILVQIGHIVMIAEHHLPQDNNPDEITQKLSSIKKSGYPDIWVSFFVGLSCACFASLNGASVAISIITLMASFVAMIFRLFLMHHHFNPFIAGIATAFVATALGALAYFLQLGDNTDIAIASSILLLVPGFPLINALSDILKGYINMGVGRWVWASMLTLSACVGIVMALLLLGIPHWGLP